VTNGNRTPITQSKIKQKRITAYLDISAFFHIDTATPLRDIKQEDTIVNEDIVTIVQIDRSTVFNVAVANKNFPAYFHIGLIKQK
jgi:hypothetical protein